MEGLGSGWVGRSSTANQLADDGSFLHCVRWTRLCFDDTAKLLRKGTKRWTAVSKLVGSSRWLLVSPSEFAACEKKKKVAALLQALVPAYLEQEKSDTAELEIATAAAQGCRAVDLQPEHAICGVAHR